MYGVVDEVGGQDLAAQGERMAVKLNDARPFRFHRFLALLREGGRKHLVGGRNVPLAMVSVRNIASFSVFYCAFSTRDFFREDCLRGRLWRSRRAVQVIAAGRPHASSGHQR